MAKARNIVVGQTVAPAQVARAKELRRTMTDAERLLWQHLRGNALNGLHFRRQQVIDGFIVDFYCHSKGVVVEVDGGLHQQQPGYDAQRDRLLSRRGLRVLRFTNAAVSADVQSVLERIAAACGVET